MTPVGITGSRCRVGRVFGKKTTPINEPKSTQDQKLTAPLFFEDTTGDGIADKRTVFHEGLTLSTDLLFGPMAISTSAPVRSSAVFDAATKQKLMLLQKERYP